MHFLYSKKASSAHRGLCAPFRLFFFYSFTLFPFLFLTKYSKAACERQQLCVLYNRLCQHLPKPAFAQAKQQIQKEEKDFFFPIPQGPGTSQRLSLHKHAQCFRTPLTGGNKRCGVVEISQPSTGEKKRSLKERHLLQHAFMRGFAC